MMADGVMLNAYPDSCGDTLADAVALLERREFSGAFRYFYILPSLFRSDLDRGFSVISYDLDEDAATRADLEAIDRLGIELKLDFVLNHLSVGSPQFRDLLERGDASPSAEMFIDWNRFWDGRGTMGPDGCLIPDEEHREKLFMRKPGLPVLRVPFPDGSDRFYWNTFYQSVRVIPPDAETLRTGLGMSEDEAVEASALIRSAVESGTAVREADFGRLLGQRDALVRFVERRCTEYLGQMDLDARSEVVWSFYEETLDKLASYGARIVRLDAFAYLHKEAGRSNFFNEPGTWDYLERIRALADRRGIALLPEIHSRYSDGIHEKLAERGYPFYDFFFPALLIHAVETGSGEVLSAWIAEIRDRGFSTVNMLGCHDGIPVLDVKGLLEDRDIDRMIDLITARGGRVKDLYGADGQKISYYQVNATFFSALGEDESAMLLARAIQMFMPGIPEVWYLDIFAGTNDVEAADRGGHKEINRTNLRIADIEARLEWPLVRRQLALLKFRNSHPAFGPGARLQIGGDGKGRLRLSWIRDGAQATLDADLSGRRFEITTRDSRGERVLEMA